MKRYEPSGTAHLNFLRAAAALWVLTDHCIIWGGAVQAIPFPNAKIAVDIFMVLSGYLMAHTVSRREAREPMGRPVNWLRFYARRFFRIAPLYYVVLLLVFVIAPATPHGFKELQALNPAEWAWNDGRWDTPFNAHSLWLHLTFLFSLSPRYSSSTTLPDWSLGLEMQFYLAFPLVFLAFRRYGPIFVAIALGIACLLLNPVVVPLFREPSPLVYGLPCFLVGMMLFEAAARRRLAYIVVAAVLCLIRLPQYGIDLGWLLGALALIATCSMRPVPRLQRLFGARPVTFLADISYSVYLIHAPVLALLGSRVAWALHDAGWPRAAATLPLWIVVLSITLAISAATYWLIERPGMRLGARLLASRATPSATAQPVSP